MKSVRNENPIETNSDPIFMSENGLVVLEIRIRENLRVISNMRLKGDLARP